MQSRDFAYWLQGFFEIVSVDGHDIHMSPGQVKMIQNHLAMVFKHEIDPSMGDQAHQSALNGLHGKPIDGLIARC